MALQIIIKMFNFKSTFIGIRVLKFKPSQIPIYRVVKYCTELPCLLKKKEIKGLQLWPPSFYGCTIGTFRTLVCPSQLGIHFFQKKNATVRSNLREPELNLFIDKMKTNIIPNSEEVIHADDVKKLIAICECNCTHLNLTIDAVNKYYQDCRLLEYEPENFGPILARLFYVLDQPDVALKVMRNEDLKTRFAQYSSFLIIFDLLYRHERYEDVIHLTDEIMKKNLLYYPKNCLVVACAAAYKINSDEVFQLTLNWLKDIENGGRRANLRSIIFMAAIALNRNQITIAKALITKIENISSVLTNNIFLLSSCHLGEYDDVLDSFRISLHMNKLGRSQPILTRDVLERIESVILKAENKDLEADFYKLKELLDKSSLISNQSYEELLFEPITDAMKTHSKRLTRREADYLDDSNV